MKIKLKFLLISYQAVIAVLFLISSCSKHETANSDLIPEIGEWKVSNWTLTTYKNNQVVSTKSDTDIGSFKLNDANFGDVSEGTINEVKKVDSPVFFYSAQPCVSDYYWQSDDKRIGFLINTCLNSSTSYTYTIDGFGSNDQTWTRVELEPSGFIAVKEVFKVKR